MLPKEMKEKIIRLIMMKVTDLPEESFILHNYTMTEAFMKDLFIITPVL